MLCRSSLVRLSLLQPNVILQALTVEVSLDETDVVLFLFSNFVKPSRTGPSASVLLKLNSLLQNIYLDHIFRKLHEIRCCYV